MDLMKELQNIIADKSNEPKNSTTADSQNAVEPLAKNSQVYESARAIAEVQATKEIVTDPAKAIQAKLNQKIAQQMDESNEVATKIDETVDRLVDKGLIAHENNADAQITRSEDAIVEADFVKNQNEYLYHGIDHKITKKWQRNLILAINNFWFVVWAIVSFFTIVPISTFLSRVKALKGIVKGFAITMGILFLLAILGGITYAILRACGVNIFG